MNKLLEDGVEGEPVIGKAENFRLSAGAGLCQQNQLQETVYYIANREPRLRCHVL